MAGGSSFLRLPEEWPIQNSCSVETLPEQSEILHVQAEPVVSLASTINVARFSSFIRLMRVTGRVVLLYKYLITISQVTKLQLEDAEYFWIKEAQKCII